MRPSLALSFVGLVCLAGLAAAQQPSQYQPKFRAGIDVVELDVSVLDKNRQPIHGLTADDFTIRENSKPQPIVAFKPVDIPEEAPAPETPWIRDVAPDVRRNDEVKDPRVFVIVMDDAMAVPEAWILASTRKIARQVIAKLGPSDLAAVTFTLAGADSQELTSDHARLLAAVDRFSSGFHDVMPTKGFEIAEEPHFLAPLRTLQAVAEALIAAPQSRKAIVYISSGVPVDYSEAAVRSLGANSSSVRGSGATTVSTTAMREMQIRLIDDMKEVFTQARLANINVYCIDSGGLDGLDSYLARKRVEARMTVNQWVPTYEDGNRYREFSQTMASNTGGLAVINTNDFAPGIAQMFRENGSYYAIGYQSTDVRRDGSYRRIEVKVNRPGAIVRAKSGYYAERTVNDQKAAVMAATKALPAQALAGALPSGDVPLQLAVTTFALPDPKVSAVAITLGVRQPADTASTDAGALDLVFTAFTTQQKQQATQSLHVKSAPAGPPSGGIAYEVVTRLDLPPGRYTLRVAAKRAGDGKGGSVYTDVDVPDFTQQVVALSGVVLTATPSPPNPAPGRLQDVVPVLPTSLREFASSDNVTAFFRVYERGKTGLAPGQLAIRILDQHGASVLDDQRPIAPDRFDATGTAEFSLALPTGRLPPGPYLLTIEAAVGKSSARRDVRFRIR